MPDNTSGHNVDAQVYFRIKPNEESVKNSVYNVNNYKFQIVNLARTTLRNIIGTLTLKLVNEAAEMYFKGNAQLLRKLQATETALKSNAKIVVPSNSQLINVIGEMSGVLPVNIG
ncbi:hypothetical protein DFR58_103205 [Anaerobacterium chartisolvens]|uniref:Band 7 domain-containing protein n=1 Tax=Anaerobacterium chartisolvens TaxID=1297424 RepID=A0A369BFS4_9FIRM|nr:SPFH domain-containing protein [Anaerobacterium chartisolvens]RCX19458.1 hypothetical protein DFR58_103205 [Anaerobacterium chartisolvens]